jgi:hypothetical protein
MAIYRQLRRIVSLLAASHNFLFADHPPEHEPMAAEARW